MTGHLKYLRYVLRHKWFVLVAGRTIVRVGWWQLLIHDLSKFSPAEWGPYRRRFFSGRAGDLDHARDPDEFHRAFLHHWHRNPHHWEHWLRIKDGELEPIPMPEKYWREMVADWAGAGRAITRERDPRGWYWRNYERIVLHPETRAHVNALLANP